MFRDISIGNFQTFKLPEVLVIVMFALYPVYFEFMFDKQKAIQLEQQVLTITFKTRFWD